MFRYTDAWEQLTERIGFWVDLPDAYVTYHQSYVESVWWALATLFEKGLLYRGHKVVWWWPQGGTALSAGEVGLGYKTVDDPSIIVRFPWRDAPGTAFLAWTTTPWTLPSNCALAVHPEVRYAFVKAEGADETLVVAENLVAALFDKTPHQIEKVVAGAELVGTRYVAPFDYAEPENGKAHEVIAAGFVTTDTGSGIVHVAPAFGVDDFNAAKQNGIGFLCLVMPDGKFDARVTDFAGRFCKEADRDIIRLLKKRGLLFKEEAYRHDYPFCWRADSDPLIQYARPAWFIRTTSVTPQALANNQTIRWIPEHIRDGRFGDWLKNNVDWALSRERYWGTPLPLWICDTCGHVHAVDSAAAIEARNPAAFEPFAKAKAADPSLSEHLKVHKPWIDDVVFPCDECPRHRAPRARGHRLLVRLGLHAVCAVGLPAPGPGQVRRGVPGRLHQRGHRPDARLVLLAADDLDACCSTRRRPFKSCIVLGPRHRQARQEGVEVQGQLHPARQDPRHRRRRRDALVLLRVEPAVEQHALLTGERAPRAAGVPGQAAQRLLVLHHLRGHRWLRSRTSPRRPAPSAGSSTAG